MPPRPPKPHPSPDTPDAPADPPADAPDDAPLGQPFQDAFFARHPQAEAVMRLFDYLPHAYFYAKDTRSRFVKVNHAFLENHALDREADALGKCDRDFHPPVLAEAYMAEDRRVMDGRRPIAGQVWLVPHVRKVPRWFVSSKTPLFDPAGQVIGLAGAMYRIDEPEELARYFQELLPVVQHIDRNFGDPIAMADMAALAGLSSTHFNRRFKQLLRMTPMQYLRNVRIQAAQRLLATTDKPMSDIALEVGCYDQSHFTKQFRSVTGMTPLAYRKRFRAG